MTIISESTPVARKYYDDDTRWYIENACFLENEVQPAEWEEIQKSIARNWMIAPGMKYKRVFYKDGGDLRAFKASIPMDNICIQYNLYDED